MDTPLRLLLVADPADAARAVESVRRQRPVEAALAPTPAVLAAALRDATWDAVLVVPGGPVSDADVARVVAGQPVPLFSVSSDGVPAGLTAVAAFAMPVDALDALPFVLASLATDLAEEPAAPVAAEPVSAEPVSAEPVAAEPDVAFVSAANAALTETAHAAPAFASDFSDLLPGLPGSPATRFVSAANATLAESARATAALPDALAAASHLPPDPPAPSPAAPPPAAPPPAGAPPAARAPGPAAPPVMTREAETLAQSLPIGVYRSSPDGRILYANPALADVLGVDLDALRRLDVRTELGYPRDAFSEIMRRDGAVRNHTVAWTNPRGVAVYTRENARAVVDASGRLVCYEGTMEDVTAEMAAREGERLRARHHAAVVHFAEAADTAASARELAQAAVAALLAAMQSDWVLMLLNDPDGGATLAAWAGHFPADSAAALAADPDFSRLPVAAVPMLVRDTEAELPAWLPPSIGDVLRAHRMRSLGVFPMHRAGAPLGALVAGYDAPHTFSAIEQQAAEVLAWHLSGHLARHRAEQDLRDADASLRFIAARSAQALYRLRYTPDGPGGGPGVRFDYLSPAVEALTGYDPAALEAAGGFDALVEARDVYAGDGLANHAVPDATHYHAAYRIRTRTGETRWIENHAYPWHDAEGAPLGLVGAFQDVTDCKCRADDVADAAQQALARQSALVELARLGDAVGHAGRTAELACETAGADGAAVWLTDGDRLTRRAATGLLAAAPDEPLPVALVDAAAALPDGLRVLAIDDVATDPRLGDPESGPGQAARAFFAARGTHAVLVAPVRRGPAAVGMLVLHRASPDEPWTESEAEYAGALADAVSLAVERAERAAAEEALRRSETRYRALSDLTSDYAFAVRKHLDDSHEVVWATDAFERITGLAPAAVLDADGARRIVHPDSLADLLAAFAALEATGEICVETRLVATDGRECWIRHRARVGERTPDGAVMVYHTGEDVTERKRFEADLVAARESAERSRAEAETMVRLKSAFLANMSHEIRTPLTGILGYAELLAAEVADEQRPFVASITSSGQRLLDTLNSVLDLAQLEAEGVCPDLHPLDVAQEARQAVDALRVLATRRGLALDVVADGPAVAALDGACLGRILTNLVGNALKFTDAGHVRVVVDTAAGVLPGSDGLAVRIRVRDTGIGIPEAFLPHLFDEFRQETDGPGRSHEGSGLGLAITRRLTHLLGGHLSVESRRPGGSTFTVVFPALAALPATRRALATREPAPAAPAPAPVAADPAPVAALPPAVSVDPTPAPVFRPPSPAAPDRAAAPGIPSQTSMFDFRFTSPRASAAPPDPSREPEDATVEWTTAPPPVAETPPAAAPAVAAPAVASAAVASAPTVPTPDMSAPSVPAPSGPRPAWPVDPSAGRVPVMIVRPAQPEPLSVDPPAEQPPAALPPDAPIDAGDERLPILVVEDNLDTRVLLDRILRGTYAVTAVGDARSALTAMAATRFRALVLDINLGGKETGTDILRVARSLDGYNAVFAVALTAYALPGDRERLLESGFDGYISKPFTRQSLMDVLSEGIRQ